MDGAVTIPLAALVWGGLGVVLGVVMGWGFGRQYQRRREEGLTREQAIEDTKAKVVAGVKDAASNAEIALEARAAGLKALWQRAEAELERMRK